METIHKAFSGYVHGAYPHIMELYGGLPPRFHMDGMLGTPRIKEWLRQLIIYVYRSIMVTELIALRLGAEAQVQLVHQLLVEYEANMNCKPSETAEAAIKKLKK